MTSTPASTSAGISTSNTSPSRPQRRDRPVREHSLGNGFHSSPDPFVTTWVGKIRLSSKKVLEREATAANRTVAYIIRELVENWVEEVEGARERKRKRQERAERQERERGREQREQREQR